MSRVGMVEVLRAARRLWRLAGPHPRGRLRGDEAEEINARTGCIGCPLASQERALDAILAQPDWTYLAPLSGLKPLYRELRGPRWRLRKPGVETLKDGSIASNPQRMGPLTFDARLMALDRVLDIQAKCNLGANVGGRPRIDILNDEECDRILDLVEAKTWPDGWAGDEPIATEPLDASTRMAQCSRF